MAKFPGPIGLLCVVMCCFLSSTNLPAQQTDETRILIENIHWGCYRPGDVVAARMHAHADQLRSFGYGASKYGDYLIKREQAISMHLDNKLKRLEYYFEAKRINKAYRDETHYDVRERQMLANSRLWKDISTLPELTNKTGGRAHNFLLHRLSNTVLAFQYASEQGALDQQDWLTHLQLEPEVYENLWLKQGETRFRAVGGQSIDVSWWPNALRAPTFDQQRQQLVDARIQIANGKTAEIPYEEIERLADAHQQLASALNAAWQVHEKEIKAASNANGGTRWKSDERTRWRRAFQFLDGIYLEIRKLKQSGSREVLTGEKGFEPNAPNANFVSFLNYMQRNGLEFAPATNEPDSIAAYNTTFRVMRDLYLLAADDDEAIRDPKKKTRQPAD